SGASSQVLASFSPSISSVTRRFATSKLLSVAKCFGTPRRNSATPAISLIFVSTFFGSSAKARAGARNAMEMRVARSMIDPPRMRMIVCLARKAHPQAVLRLRFCALDGTSLAHDTGRLGRGRGHQPGEGHARLVGGAHLDLNRSGDRLVIADDLGCEDVAVA